MLLKTILMLFASATIVWCQTPPGFEPSTAHKLDVKFKKNVAVQPGNEIEMADCQKKPRLKIESVSKDIEKTYFQSFFSNPRYMVFMIDIDVPQNESTVPFLHWYQPDLHLNHKSRKLSIPKSSPYAHARYYAPSPPPGSKHRYVELLFRQPASYKLPSEFEKYLGKNPSARVGFEIGELMRAAGLKPPIAGNWFLVSRADEDDIISAYMSSLRGEGNFWIG